MRSAGEIKRELLRLRFGVRLPMAKIAEDSRCSIQQLVQAMRLEATEVIQRRLDAYLDAGHLHKHSKNTKLLWRIELMKIELWTEYQAQSIPMRDMQLLSTEQQQRMATAMEHRLRRLLREKVEKEAGKTLYLADGESYWRAKAAYLRKGAKLAPLRNNGRLQRPGTVGKGKGSHQPR